jgi:hypothetical protein
LAGWRQTVFARLRWQSKAARQINIANIVASCQHKLQEACHGSNIGVGRVQSINKEWMMQAKTVEITVYMAADTFQDNQGKTCFSFLGFLQTTKVFFRRLTFGAVFVPSHYLNALDTLSSHLLSVVRYIYVERCPDVIFSLVRSPSQSHLWRLLASDVKFSLGRICSPNCVQHPRERDGETID